MTAVFNICHNSRNNCYHVDSAETGFLTAVDSLRAALLFIALRRQLSMEKTDRFTINYTGDLFA